MISHSPKTASLSESPLKQEAIQGGSSKNSPGKNREMFLSPVEAKCRKWFVEPQTEIVFNMSSVLKKTMPGKSQPGFLDYTPESTKKFPAQISSFTKGRKLENCFSDCPSQEPRIEVDEAMSEYLTPKSSRRLRVTAPSQDPVQVINLDIPESTTRRLLFDSHPSPPPPLLVHRCTICSVSVNYFRIELSCCPNTNLCKRCFDKFYLKQRASEARCPYCKTKEALTFFSRISEPVSPQLGEDFTVRTPLGAVCDDHDHNSRAPDQSKDF